MAPPKRLTEIISGRGLALSLGLGKTDGALALFPFAALLHEFDAFEAFHNRTFTSCAAFTFERVVLGHRIRKIGLRARKLGGSGELGKDEFRCFRFPYHLGLFRSLFNVGSGDQRFSGLFGARSKRHLGNGDRFKTMAGPGGSRRRWPGRDASSFHPGCSGRFAGRARGTRRAGLLRLSQ